MAKTSKDGKKKEKGLFDEIGEAVDFLLTGDIFDGVAEDKKRSKREDESEDDGDDGDGEAEDRSERRTRREGGTAININVGKPARKRSDADPAASRTGKAPRKQEPAEDDGDA